ncbi:excinuclease ABC subunit UvrA [Streptomyces sp. BK205]|uniref:excinuclease ABC subunit UvrA n=1 Tax=Streptomyces sp. BK205 TaxID=2512164 RepID=UPI001A9F6572|nr:excinuclease ABC subunit UvrA [Streptomyces sp. BK205]
MTVEIPRRAITVITGPSGSGKSSLAFDTIFAEGQRQYLESLSPFQRRSFDQLPKPKVTAITGLGPAIAVRQHTPARNPRSTVGSITEIGNYVRLLYSRAGVHTCLRCGTDVAPRSPEELVADGVTAIGDAAAVLSLVRRSTLTSPAPVRKQLARCAAGTPHAELVELLRRCVVQMERTEDALLLAEPAGGPPRYLDTEWACAVCGRPVHATSSQYFSPNSPEGMCPRCEGLGLRFAVSGDLLVADENASIRAGALTFYGDRRREPKKTYWPMQDLPKLLDLFGSSLDTVWRSLTPALRELILYGRTEHPVPPDAEAYLATRSDTGLAPNIERLFRAAGTVDRKEFYQRFMVSAPCAECGGSRLKREALAVRLAGDGIADTMARPLRELPDWLDRVLAEDMPELVGVAVKEIDAELRRRIEHVRDVGLGYLSLDRPVPTLSAGEGQRLRIAKQLSSTLVDLVYVLDEPSVGLHPADTHRLTSSLRRLRDLGNTVIVVEHDAEVMRGADHLVDIGPGAGALGGRVVLTGSPAEVERTGASPTARQLRGELEHGPESGRRRPEHGAELVLSGASLHNLRDVTVRFPLGLFTCVTGPSGSGKSTLVNSVLQPAVSEALAHRGRLPRGPFTDLTGHEAFARTVSAVQDPMGRNSRSIPATYIGIFDEIRRLFARLPLSVRNRWSTAHFSFNSEAGRCWTCRGTGERTMELHFLPDVAVPCPSCGGHRFNQEVLAATWGGRSIAEVLDLDVGTAAEFFADQPRIARPLRLLTEVGLGYLKLGQNAVTLSGGEAQRLKLARELCQSTPDGPCLYVLDEPTSGLHASDVILLTAFLHRLVDAGHTVIVIEHNVDVVASADWVIDLGPGSGEEGGTVVIEGTPEAVAGHQGSALAPFLAQVLSTRRLRGTSG